MGFVVLTPPPNRSSSPSALSTESGLPNRTFEDLGVDFLVFDGIAFEEEDDDPNKSTSSSSDKGVPNRSGVFLVVVVVAAGFWLSFGLVISFDKEGKYA